MNQSISTVICCAAMAFSGLSFAQQGEPSMKTTKTSPAELTELQRHVVLEDGTEPPFDNAYWDNKEPGLYVDIQDGQPLFSSIHKYKSGTGWPSFTQPVTDDALVEKIDKGFFTTRTEVRSSSADSHLGHVFEDGPVKAGGLRYCINSASLRFIPASKLEEEGYGEYSSMFEE